MILFGDRIFAEAITLRQGHAGLGWDLILMIRVLIKGDTQNCTWL
jgi:hypothetical protein